MTRLELKEEKDGFVSLWRVSSGVTQYFSVQFWICGARCGSLPYSTEEEAREAYEEMCEAWA